ncbi:MAG: hypothetical protein H3C62_11020 [Gemmatimonadaceae bacterium]|nr:hypothetical protein [Gemmatimonadaceae bacterium]
MRTISITMNAKSHREFLDLADHRKETPAQALQVALALYAHASDAIRAGRQVLIADAAGTPLRQLRLPGVSHVPWWRRMLDHLASARA